MAGADDIDIVSDLQNNPVEPTVPVDGGSSGASTPPVDTPKVDAELSKDKPLSLRDQISSALKGEVDTPPVAQQDGRPRNPDGTFAPKEPATPDLNAAPPPQQQVPPPRGMDVAQLDVFNKLPAELQAPFARTMEVLEQRAQQYAHYDQMEQLLAPRRNGWALDGMSDAQALNQLLALSDFARERPAEFIAYFAQQRGVDLEQVLYGSEPVDPNLAALQAQVRELQGHLSGMTVQQQQAAHQATVNEVIAFSSEKGPDGNMLRPHFGELGDSVLPFIQAVMQQNPQMPRTQILQEAYDRACWGTPSVRAKMQSATQAATDAARIQEQQDTAKRARAAGSSMPSGVPNADSTDKSLNGSRSLRDTIRASIAAST